MDEREQQHRRGSDGSGSGSSRGLSARAAAAAGVKDFQRVYKACESCRKKKVRCVLDASGAAAGNLPGAPCARCRRELRECVFSKERSSTTNVTNDIAPRKGRRGMPSPAETDSRDGRGHRKGRESIGGEDSTSMNDLDAVPQRQMSHFHTPTETSSEVSNRRHDQQLRQAQDLLHMSTVPGRNVIAEDGLTDTVMRTLVSTGNDALDLLFRAAGHREEAQDTHTTHLTFGGISSGSPTAAGYGTPGVLSSMSTAMEKRQQETRMMMAQVSKVPPSTMDVWTAFRFVKMGWFTAQEALTYMDLFFKNIAPLSPVSQCIPSSHCDHFALVTQEPLLCCVILMISSRYHILPGAGGATRSTLIHQRLWEHCQHLIMRIIFGQEKRSKAKTRTVGAVEALLLMLEWHPNAIHFPPASDGWDSDLLLTTSDRRDPPSGNTADWRPSDESRAKWLEEVVTPARMSDRMSWMLLGCAQTLAHELGVCDASGSNNDINSNNITDSASQSDRHLRISKMLFIFVEQLSFRLGCPSTVPSSLTRCATEPCTDSRQSAFLIGWVELTNLLRTVSDVLFPSGMTIRQLLASSRYVNVIKHFQQQLLSWKTLHLREENLEAAAFRDLSIEFHCLRSLVNSLGIQAVVERANGKRSGINTSSDHTNSSDLQTLQLSLRPTDFEFIQEVVDGCCQLLQTVNGMAELGLLRFCPVRTFLRIITASILLLKALSLGSHTTNLQASLGILEETIRVLRLSSLDDMHLASRYAALLDRHLITFRQSLVPSSVPRGISLSGDFGMNTTPWDTSHEHGDILHSASGDEAGNTFGGSSDFQTPSDWLSLPFDPAMAPFGFTDMEGLDFGMIGDSDRRAWDFLWNLPG